MDLKIRAIPISDEELRNVHLFAGLDGGQIARMREATHCLRLTEGEWLFDQGEPASRFYYVRSGQIKLFRLSPEGNEKVIEVFRPGQTFAEAVMFMDRECYPVNAAALSAAELLAFDNSTFRALVGESPETALRLLGDLSMRLHRRLDEIENLTLQNATYRTVNYLLTELADGKRGPTGNIRLTIPKGVLASRLSITRETFSRILHNLGEQGLIEVDGPTIHITDCESLRAFTQ